MIKQLERNLSKAEERSELKLQKERSVDDHSTSQEQLKKGSKDSERSRSRNKKDADADRRETRGLRVQD